MNVSKTKPAFDNLPNGVIITDSKFKVQYYNREMERLTGFALNECIGKSLNSIVFSEVQGNKEVDFKQCIKSKYDRITKSAFINHKAGRRTLVFISASFNNNSLIVMITDISSEITCASDSAESLSLIKFSSEMKIIGHDKKIKSMNQLISLAAESMANVIISGESGTGKELVASAIHYLSVRKSKPFVIVNCSALTESLLESELFGHVKGSYTGAYKDKKGKFEAAAGGTVFLDEIGEISPMIQVKLLRVIQEKTIERVGENRVISVDIRILSATNKNLRELVNKGLFREDLFYRLNVFPITTPPLREHKSDIALLVEYFIDRYNKQTGKHIKGLTEDAYRILMDYCWPGNVRELENSIEHAFVLCHKKLIDVFDLPQDIRLVQLRQGLCKNIETPNQPAYFYQEKEVPSLSSIPSSIKSRHLKKEELQQLLDMNHQSRLLTAQQLGISRVALWKKMKNFGLL